MLNINEFAAQYRISPSWARQLVRAGEIRAEKSNGRYHIAREEAERWMAENPYRHWVRIITRPDLPAIALGYDDAFTLDICSNYYGADLLRAQSSRWEPRVHQLRELGFTIERGWRRGNYPYYCLKDIVEIRNLGKVDRLGPHPDYQNLR
jgi:hypothetical protein